MLVLSGTFTCKPGAAPTLVALARDLLPKSRAEDGCIRYDFLQDPIVPERFVFFELWRDQAALAAHFTQPHFKKFGDAFPGLIVGAAEIVTYETPGPQPAF